MNRITRRARKPTQESPAWPRMRRLLLAAGCAVASTATPAQPAVPIDDLSLEDLLKVRVTAATRIAQPIDEAPAAVTVVTAAQIRRFGYRTLAEILDSIPGLYVNNDRTYNYLGVRGFSRAGDYNTRVLMLVDGNRLNDNVFNTAAIGGDFPLEVESIERVEFVPGAGSALYGSNAFFGVINVISRHAQAKPGVEAALKIDSQQRSAAWLGLTAAIGETGKLTIDSARHGGSGPTLYYAAFDAPGTANGVERGVDFAREQRIAARYTSGGFSTSLLANDRSKGLSGAPYSVNFNDPAAVSRDRLMAADASYSFVAGPVTDMTVRGSWGQYQFHGAYPGAVMNRDFSLGQWYGGEARVVHRGWSGHVLQAGIELRRDARIIQRNFDDAPSATHLDDTRKGSQQSVFVQDEWRLGASILTLGIRRDHFSAVGSAINPRASWVAPFGEGYIFKVSTGTAFRAPNAYETHYATPSSVPPNKANPGLKPERIRSLDVGVNRTFGRWNAGINAWTYRMSDVIAQVTDPSDGALVFRNGGTLLGRGADLEASYRWAGGSQAGLAMTFQQVRDISGGPAVGDAPSRLAKLRFSTRVGSSARLALTLQGIGRRLGELDRVPGSAMSNLVLSSLKLGPNLSLDAGVYNLFNQRALHPISTSFSFNAMPQDGRHLQLTLRLDFK